MPVRSFWALIHRSLWAIIMQDRTTFCLPAGTARFYSVLNVETFMKKTSIIAYTQGALTAVGSDVIKMAEAEGLQAHANAIRVRMEKR